MDRYREGTVVKVEVGFYREDETPVDAQAVTYRVKDESETVLLDSTNVSVEPKDTFVLINVPSNLNTLASGVKKSIREVEVQMTDVYSRIHTASVRYIIDKHSALEFGVNTFQTLNEALLDATDIQNTTGWDGASNVEQESALIEAFDRLGTLIISNDAAQNKLSDRYWRSGRLRDYTAQELATIDAELLTQLKIAQILQANNLLGGDYLETQRNEGVVSQMEGQSITGLNRIKPPEFYVCNRALKALTGFVKFW